MNHTITKEAIQPLDSSNRNFELAEASNTKETVSSEEVLSILGPTGTIELTESSNTKETVSSEEVLSILGPTGTIELKEKAALSLIIAIVAVVSIAIISVGWAWLKQVPPLPSVNDPNAKVLIENYKALREVSTEQTVKMLDEVVTKLLMPILTAMGGYVWGKSKGNQPGNSRNTARRTQRGRGP